MNDPLGLFGEEEQNADPLGLFGNTPKQVRTDVSQIPAGPGADQYAAPTPEPSLFDKLIAAGEAGAQVISGLPGMVAGPLMGLQAATRGASPKEAEDIAAKQMEAMTYAPRTPLGQEYASNVGEVINKYLMPIAPLAHLPSIKAKEGVTAARAMLPERAVVETPKAPVGGVKGLAAELAAPEPVPVLKGQGELFAPETEGLASPYNAGQAGVTEPISPLRARAQIELPLRNDLPAQMMADERGVITPELPNEAMQLAKERADRAAVAPEEIPPTQADLFAPETNVHRAYTDIRAATEAGGERPLTREEFAQVHENLAKEPVTAHEVPHDLDAAYQKYLEQVSGKQADMFDIGSRQEVFGQEAFKEQVARQLEEHPFVKKAEKELAKQEQFVSDLKEQVASGETSATALAVEMKALEKAQEKVATVRTNVETALTNRQKPSPFRGRGGKQAGAIDPSVFLGKFPEFAESIIKDAMGKLKVMYHGTSKDKAFGDIKAGPTGAWLTDKPEMASEYAKQNDSQSLKYNPDTRRYDELNTAGRVLPVYVNIKNPYTPTAAETQILHHARNYRSVQKALTERAKAQGHDAIDWGGGVFTAFDANQMKSALSPEFGKKTIPFNFKKQGGGVKVDWKDNNKLDVIKENPAFAESMKQVGHAMIATPEEAVALAKAAPDVSQNIGQRALNALTKGGTYLKAKVNNPVVHFTVDRFLNADNLAKAEISEKLHGEYLGNLRKLSKSEYAEAYELLNAADLSKKSITPEMMQRHGLSPALQDFITTHQNIMTDVLGKINEARAAVGKKPIEARDAYSAMNMTGDFRKAAYKTIDGVRQVVGVIGANSKTVGKNSLAALETKMKTIDPSLEFGPLQDTTTRRGSAKGTPHEAFMDVLQTMGENNPAMKEFLDTLAEISKSDATNYLGMQKHTMQKKGVWGMEGRKPWLDEASNAKEFFENQTRYIEGAYQWGGLAKAAKDVNAVLRDGDVATKQPNAIALSEQYMQNALGLNPSRMGRAVNDAFNALFAPMGIGPSIPKEVLGMTRQIANTFLLSLNVPFLAIQLIQPVMAMPGMISYLRSRGMEAGGYSGSIKAMETLIKQRAGQPLNAVEKGAYKYAKDNHVYATDMVEHTAQTQKGPAYYTSKITQSPAAYMETGTRATVYLTMVHTLHEGGLTPARGLYEQAHRMTDMAMTNYGAMEKPPIYNALGPLGSTAYNLKSFGHNEISRWALFAREIPNNKNALPLLTQMATTIAVAGVMGLPFMSQWETLYDYITKKIGHPRSLTLDILKVSEEMGKGLGEKGKYALSNGLGVLAGMDISKRVGLGDVLPSNASDVAFAGGGKLGQMASAVAGAIVHPSEETAKAAVINLAPPILQGPMDLAWFSKGNLAFGKDPGNLKAVARRNDADILMKSIGLTGINESVQKQKAYQNQQMDLARTEIRQAAMNTLTQDMFRNRPMLQKTLDKYFINGEGDPQTFSNEIEKKALSLNLSPTEMSMLRDAASTSITKARSLQRRM